MPTQPPARQAPQPAPPASLVTNPATCRVSFRRIDRRPDRVPGDRFTDDPARNHWRFTLSSRGSRPLAPARFSGYFTGAQGDPNPPKLADLLECLAGDAAAYLNARDLDDFAAGLGHGGKPSQAIRAFNACRKVAEGFERLGLDPFADWSQSED